MQQFFTAMWYRQGWWSLLFLPLTWLFQILALFRRHWQRRNARKFSVPIIVVGNIAVGGTGKTPLVIAIVQSLRQQGWHPAVVSRGYGSAAPHYPFAVTATTAPASSGDEPLLIAQRTGVPVMIGADRIAAVEALLAINDTENNEKKVDIIVSDDGLQHYRMRRDIEVVVIDGQRGLGNGRCLPAGPLRESATRLTQVDWVINNGELSDKNVAARLQTISKSEPKPKLKPKQTTMHIKPGAWVNLYDGNCLNVESMPTGEKMHAVAGIGNPQRFFDTLMALGMDIIPHAFPDHHQFQATDIQFGDDYTIVMTEKDAVKCQPLISTCPVPKRYWCLQVEAELEPQFFEQLDQLCRQKNVNN